MNHHVVGEILAAFGLNVVYRLEPDRFDVRDRLFLQRWKPFPAKLLGACHRQFPSFVFGDKSDQVLELDTRFWVCDRNEVRRAPLLSTLCASLHARIDPQVQQQHLDVQCQLLRSRGQHNVRGVGRTRTKADSRVHLEQGRKVGRLRLEAQRPNPRRHRGLRTPAQQVILFEKHAEGFSVQANAAEIQTSGLGLGGGDLIEHSLEDPLCPFHDEVEFFLIDRHELYRVVALCALLVLIDKPICLQPAS